MAFVVVAEVMDKEITVLEAWMLAAVVGVLGYCLARWKAPPVLLVLVLIGVSAWAVATELADPVLGSAILNELGSNYPIQVYAAHALAAVATLTGAIRGYTTGRRRAA